MSRENTALTLREKLMRTDGWTMFLNRACWRRGLEKKNELVTKNTRCLTPLRFRRSHRRTYRFRPEWNVRSWQRVMQAHPRLGVWNDQSLTRVTLLKRKIEEKKYYSTTRESQRLYTSVVRHNERRFRLLRLPRRVRLGCGYYHVSTTIERLNALNRMIKFNLNMFSQLILSNYSMSLNL